MQPHRFRYPYITVLENLNLTRSPSMTTSGGSKLLTPLVISGKDTTVPGLGVPVRLTLNSTRSSRQMSQIMRAVRRPRPNLIQPDVLRQKLALYQCAVWIGRSGNDPMLMLGKAGVDNTCCWALPEASTKRAQQRLSACSCSTTPRKHAGNRYVSRVSFHAMT